jgi:hypothetical protein
MKLFDPTVELHFFANNILHKITGLQMDFDIVSSNDDKPNQAKIVVYQLAEKTRNMFTEQHQGIEFHAGYSGKPKLIFRGVTTNVLHVNNDTDWQTIIYAGDGQKEYTSNHFNKSYSKGTPIIKILADLALALGIPFESNYTGSDVLLRGETYSGLVKDVLQEITDDYFLRWAILNGQLEITEPGQPTLSRVAVKVLNADTGLIGSPIVTERTATTKKKRKGKKKKAEERIIGIQATALMIPEIKPNSIVAIQSIQLISSGLGKLMEVKIPKITAIGVYLVDRVRYIGNNYGGRFDVELEADLTQVAV